VPGRRFTAEELEAIDAAYRGDGLARCPHDLKPLLTTTWQAKLRMVYFLCRVCGRIGAIGYETDDPRLPGIVARGPQPSSRPPPTR
jgi:hypothetical protein